MNRRFSSEHIEWPPKKISRACPEDVIKPKEEEIKYVSPFRIAAPQILASTAKNMLLLDLGMTVAFSTIVIPVLLEARDPMGLSFTKDEASWFGSLVFICQPLGSILSGMVLEPLGRKKSMMLVNLPHIGGWLLFYFAEGKAMLYLAAAIMGLGVGFMEAPIITYVGEISQPHLRGTLTSYSNLFVSFGMMLIYLIGSLADWRTTAVISTAIPIVTILAISQVPETPIWLMARGRFDDAEKSLCWLRGWVSPEHVKKEFEELTRYSESTKLKRYTTNGVVNPGFIPDDSSVNQEQKSFHELSFGDKVKDFVRPGMLKPLGLIIAFFFFGNFTGITATRPYMILLAKEFQMPLDPSWTTVVFGAVSFCGSICCMITIAKFKKRPIALSSMLAASLSGYGLYFWRDPWAAFIFYLILTFFSSYGAYGLVWTLVSEVFPFRGRGVASGIAAASSYIISFVATKTYQTLQDLLTMRGVFAFYGSISLIGLIFLFFLMPETEGRELEDIENDYDRKPSTTPSVDKPTRVV